MNSLKLNKAKTFNSDFLVNKHLTKINKQVHNYAKKCDRN